MIDISSWHTAADNPPDRIPLLCYCDADDSVFLGFAIHPYLSLDRTVSLVNWYKQTGLHEWQRVEHIVTRWKEVNLDVV